MFSKDVTVDKILRGKISIIQLKKGFRYGFEAVFLASIVNGYLKKIKKKKVNGYYFDGKKCIVLYEDN